KDPDKYYWNNVHGPVQLLHLAKNKLEKVVFSSSAAVYGEPDSVPIPESHPTRPKSPYGETKLVIERLLDSYAQAYGIKTVSLRYFNAAGSDPDGDLGEDHEPEEHLIPLAVLAAMGLRPPLTIFGDDYPTPDGTCIRDYVHVSDLAEAHLAALESDCPPVINLGSGKGHSVREVIATVEKIVGPVPHTVGPRRPGDPARLVASNDLARRVLGWKPQYGLEDMVAHAHAWRRKFPKGYAGAPRSYVRRKPLASKTKPPRNKE
ncbi:MAG: UDP-glucose 4-epimerase GalE, partial [Fimbriimonadales bacterium]|nr:UDP-glucose 4-epimerase GalE [Fimbriimonadales bacterium]